MAVVEQFCIYAHEDKELQVLLDTHFWPCRREGLLQHFSDRDIGGGAKWQGVIDSYLESADIILLLISPDFFKSTYIYDTEMKRALERERNGEAVVIPVLLRPVVWKNSPIAYLQALPSEEKSITCFKNFDEGCRQVVEAVRQVALGVQARKSRSEGTDLR